MNTTIVETSLIKITIIYSNYKLLGLSVYVCKRELFQNEIKWNGLTYPTLRIYVNKGKINTSIRMQLST